jgi:hypothetical protein
MRLSEDRYLSRDAPVRAFASLSDSLTLLGRCDEGVRGVHLGSNTSAGVRDDR